MKQINGQNENITLVFLQFMFYLLDAASSELNQTCLERK